MNANAPAILQIQRLEKRYGESLALGGVDLELRAGEAVGLLGPNGAGKSTLVKVACGLVRASGGEARIAGHPAGSPAARARLGYLAELFRYPGWLTADELLSLHQRLSRSGGNGNERGALLDLVGLGDRAHSRIEAMSKGMQQRLGLAQAMVGNPDLLILDEPTAALDPAGRVMVRDLINSLRERGTALLISSHLLGEIERSCDRVVMLDRGMVIVSGTPQSLTAAGGVEVELEGGLRHFPELTREDIPELIARLAGQGERVYAVREMRRTLEQAYLEQLGREPS